MQEAATTADHVGAAMAARAGVAEDVTIHGVFTMECRDADGTLLWREEFDNVVTTLGKNLLLDTTLAGSAYTVVGPFLGLISSVSFTATAAGDTMASHAGWLESGGASAPSMSSTRGTCAWSAAANGAKPLSAAATYSFTGAGTLQGAFLVLGTGAVNTVGDTNGTLYSAGVFGTPQPVIAGNVVSTSYTASLT
jgi:hypothetical protein